MEIRIAIDGETTVIDTETWEAEEGGTYEDMVYEARHRRSDVELRQEMEDTLSMLWHPDTLVWAYVIDQEMSQRGM